MKEKLIMAYEKALKEVTDRRITINSSGLSISIKNKIGLYITSNPPSIMFNGIVESLTELEYNDLYMKTYKRNEEILEKIKEEKKIESLKLLDEYLND